MLPRKHSEVKQASELRTDSRHETEGFVHLAQPMSLKKITGRNTIQYTCQEELRELTTAPTRAVLKENKPKLRLIVVLKWIWEQDPQYHYVLGTVWYFVLAFRNLSTGAPERLSCVPEYPHPVLEATTTSSMSLALTLCQLHPRRLQRSHSLLANLAPPWLCAGEVSPSELHETRILTQLGSIPLNPQSCTGSVWLQVPGNRTSPPTVMLLFTSSSAHRCAEFLVLSLLQQGPILKESKSKWSKEWQKNK